MMKLIIWLWLLTIPKRYRAEFLPIYEQWKDTTRIEGGFWWARQVFYEYVWPAEAYRDEDRAILEQQRTEDQAAGA